MWGRHRKLQEWVAAGVITEGAAQAIEAYEDKRKKGHFGRGLVNLSIFAILVGVLSIIASNWHEIPGLVKIGVHVLLNVIVGALALWADRTGRDIWREGAALAFIGLTLTLIVLVGQVYQLTGTAASALGLWLLITLPFFLLMGKTYATAAPWMLAFLATLFMLVSEHIDKLPEDDRAWFYIGIPALLPLALMADGGIAAFRRWRPALAETSLKAGMVLSGLFACFSIVFWGIGDIHIRPTEYTGQTQALVILAIGLAAMGAHAAWHKFYAGHPHRKAGALFALVGFVVMLLPFITMVPVGSVFSALLFIAYWVFIGWMAQNIGQMRLVSLAIFIIAVRIFIIYCELFGTLMDTGIGLISGGVVMLALIYGARKLNERLKGAQHGKA